MSVRLIQKKPNRPNLTADTVYMSVSRDPLIRKLIEKLSDPDPTTRRNAAGALRLHGARALTATKALTALLADADPRVRQEAERALDQLRIAAA